MSERPLSQRPWSRRHLVLVVDDNERFRSRVEQVLQAQGYEVMTAADGIDALSIVRDIRPDAVITDLEMPGLDGLGVCRALRELRAFDAIPLILCTHAEAADPRCREARLLVGLRVVFKPIEIHEIVALLDDLLATSTVAVQGALVAANFDRQSLAAHSPV